MGRSETGRREGKDRKKTKNDSEERGQRQGGASTKIRIKGRNISRKVTKETRRGDRQIG